MTKLPEPSLQVLHRYEPSLEFGSRQITAHPKDGLFLYGPHSRSGKGTKVRIGVVGTSDGINLFRAWAARIKKLVEVPPPGKGEKTDRLHLANFPGMEEAFGITFNENELTACTLESKEIERQPHCESARGDRKGRQALYRSECGTIIRMKSVRSTFGYSLSRRSFSSDAGLAQNDTGCRRKEAIS